MLDIVREEAERHRPDPVEVEKLFVLILEQARETQHRERSGPWSVA